MNLPPIVRAGRGDLDAATTLIATAFHDLPVTRWLVPDDDQRPAVLRGNFAILVQHAYTHGHVDLLSDRTGVAVWFNRTTPLPPPHRYAQRLAEACDPYTDRIVQLDELFDQHHPGSPHHHLAFLAVLPAHQRTGRGAALLRHHHERLDRIGVPAYLEATSPASRDLYRRHGYDVLSRFEVAERVAFWRMWRPPQRPTSHPANGAAGHRLTVPVFPIVEGTSR